MSHSRHGDQALSELIGCSIFCCAKANGPLKRAVAVQKTEVNPQMPTPRPATERHDCILLEMPGCSTNRNRGKLISSL